MSGKFMMNGIEYLGGGSGGGGGNVDDVYVNGESVLDENKIAQVTSYKEVTLAEYMALPDTKLTDGIMYCIKDIGGANQFPPLIYSDEEREVGVWRDGKPLYQRTFIGTCPNHTGQTIVQTLNEEILAKNVSGYIEYAQGNSVFIPNYESSTWKVIFSISTVNGVSTLRIEVGSDLFNKPFYATLQYTKTTDTPGSGTWTTDGTYAHHYSTSEKVIGTWIDGKPIYEKTFTGLSRALQANDWNTLNDCISIPNIAETINVRAMRVAGNNCLADIGLKEFSATPEVNSLQINPFNSDTMSLLIAQYTKTTD